MREMVDAADLIDAIDRARTCGLTLGDIVKHASVSKCTLQRMRESGQVTDKVADKLICTLYVIWPTKSPRPLPVIQRFKALEKAGKVQQVGARKQRRCLSCGTQFTSTNFGHRMCSTCRSHSDWMGDMTCHHPA